MKVLITGFAGFLGQYLADALRERGMALRVVLNRHTILRSQLRPGTEIVWGNITDSATIEKALDGVDAVVHAAWAFSAKDCQRPTANEVASEQLFRRSIARGVKRFVFISSVSVYGTRAPRGAIIDETSPLAQAREASYIYPAEKMAIEKQLQSISRGKMALAIFRPGPIFDERKGPVRKVTKIGPLLVGVGMVSGRGHNGLIHAKDVAQGVCLWLEKGADGGVFNVVSSDCLRAREWMRAWGTRKGLRLHPFFIPAPLLRLAGFGVGVLKRLLHKSNTSDTNFAIACARRNMVFQNGALKRALGWNDAETSMYVRLVKKA